MNLNLFFEDLDTSPDVSNIQRDCAEFLNWLPANGLLFRGINFRKGSAPVEPQLFSASNARTPRDSSMAAHKFISELQRKAGWPVNRENSYFAAGGRLNDLNEFGVIGAVFPIGQPGVDWNYAWCRDATDRVFYTLHDVRTAMFKSAMPDVYFNKAHFDLMNKMAWICQIVLNTENNRLGGGDAKAILAFYKKITKDLDKMNQITVSNLSTKELKDQLLEWYEICRLQFPKFMELIRPTTEISHESWLTSMYEKAKTNYNYYIKSVQAFLTDSPEDRLEKLGWIFNPGKSDFQAAIKSTHEIMLTGKYYWIALNNPLGQEMCRKLRGGRIHLTKSDDEEWLSAYAV